MKIFYEQTLNQTHSFANELNRWLWPQLSPELFKRKPVAATGLHGLSLSRETGLKRLDASVFVGAGTLLNTALTSQVCTDKTVAIFGTGVSGKQPLSTLPQHWSVHCVRGPLSARQLGIPVSKVITDSGLLIAQLFEASSQREDCSFMPHRCHAREAGESWQRICAQAGIRYIDPCWSVEQILRAIAASDRILTESLHGAIVADALRIPWIPIASSPRISTFEWQDWCLSLSLFYHPYRLPALKSYPRWSQGIRSSALAIKHWLYATLEGPASTPEYALFCDERTLAQRLTNIAKQSPTLSTDETFTQKIEDLKHCFDQFCHQYTRETVMQ